MTPWIWLLVALAGFASGWEVQSWRYGAKEAQRAQQELVDQQSATETAILRNKQITVAETAASARELALRRAADSARRALDGLRGASDRALQDAGTSLGACLERAHTFSELLNTMADTGRGLAEKADRHASDAQTCHDGWPK